MKKPTCALIIREYKGIARHWRNPYIIQKTEEQAGRLHVVYIYGLNIYVTHTYIIIHTI